VHLAIFHARGRTEKQGYPLSAHRYR
jgi:hypothetical protein